VIGCLTNSDAKLLSSESACIGCRITFNEGLLIQMPDAVGLVQNVKDRFA